MASHNAERPAPVTGNGPLTDSSSLAADASVSSARSTHCQAVRRVRAYCRVLDALIEQRQALAHRLWIADATDRHLEPDCRVWCELADAVADYLTARKSA